MMHLLNRLLDFLRGGSIVRDELSDIEWTPFEEGRTS